MIESGDYASLATYLALRCGIVMAAMACIFASCVIDFWSGIDAAKALGQPLDSHGFRKTMTKFGDYFRVLLMGGFFDLMGLFFDFYELPYACMVVTFGCIVIEGKSVFENSRRKKSNAGKIPEAVKEIIAAKDEAQALGIIKNMAELFNSIAKNQKWERE